MKIRLPLEEILDPTLPRRAPLNIQVRSLVSQLTKYENIWASSTISKILAKKRLGEGGMGSITKFYNCLFYTIELIYRRGDSVHDTIQRGGVVDCIRKHLKDHSVKQDFYSHTKLK